MNTQIEMPNNEPVWWTNSVCQFIWIYCV